MGKYQTYSEYRSWNNKWISCLPASWQLVPLKYICSGFVKDGPHETPKFTDDGIPFLSVDGIQDNKLVFNGCRYISEEDHVRYSMKCHPKQGDVLLGKAASVGKVAYVDSNMDFNVWSPLAVITAKSNKYGKYIYYCLQSSMLQAQCEVFANSNTQKNLGMNTIDNLDMPLPSEHEADVITNFLDHETAKIDTLIEKQQQLIKLLKEKRQAVISHAVTKGLNPQAPMKDSGVEWLGEVPEHWVVSRVKNVVSRIVDGPHFSPKYVDDGYMFISARNIKVDRWSLDDAKFVSEKDFFEFNKRVKPEKGDVLLTKGGTTGVARAVDLDIPFQVWVHVAVLKTIKTKIDPFYFAYVLNGSSCYEQSQLSTYGATNNDLGLSRIAQIVFACPPITEQGEIRKLLDSRCEKIDTLVAKAEHQVSLMKERRTALISAAVTGKIDVRNWQTPTSQNQSA
ncbi:TPA: restriction endonuclease subunit S [Vibrio parahaemolyticus]|nr:restriction endonuclease subunit S [Vibrio parahaemolyticus]HCG9431493.1 restriction endonuclease subunit S [Vibrio parahaemolyticus]HCG9628608.1 restriction endonuclease subunit S [Vibrio parahaemolyticus]HCH3557359.1 restriction endonuclease subunit S [Vibrio parahaemolyticus]